ncbi:hypothetical protein BDY24DRAFT_143150 [Mrakia frigida]|uniref:uncharacterized protein n=1 Tax=Mrakia frigida TaxID=29902 RepID=UPI003FCC0444
MGSQGVLWTNGEQEDLARFLATQTPPYHRAEFLKYARKHHRTIEAYERRYRLHRDFFDRRVRRIQASTTVPAYVEPDSEPEGSKTPQQRKRAKPKTPKYVKESDDASDDPTRTTVSWRRRKPRGAPLDRGTSPDFSTYSERQQRDLVRLLSNKSGSVKSVFFEFAKLYPSKTSSAAIQHYYGYRAHYDRLSGRARPSETRNRNRRRRKRRLRRKRRTTVRSDETRPPGLVTFPFTRMDPFQLQLLLPCWARSRTSNDRRCQSKPISRQRRRRKSRRPRTRLPPHQITILPTPPLPILLAPITSTMLLLRPAQHFPSLTTPLPLLPLPPPLPQTTTPSLSNLHPSFDSEPDPPLVRSTSSTATSAASLDDVDRSPSSSSSWSEGTRGTTMLERSKRDLDATGVRGSITGDSTLRRLRG